MNHNELQMLVSSSFDNELTEVEKEIVQKHLSLCETCQQFLKESKQIRSDIQGLGPFELPSHFSRTIIQTIESQEYRQSEWMGIEAFARHAFYAIAMIVVTTFVVSEFGVSTVSTPVDPFMAGFEADSSTTHFIIQSQELSKEDILYSVMTK
jgi:predicted anti-sigma-YlaC factor YlaD